MSDAEEQTLGQLAAASGHAAPLEVCKSRAGFYLGTRDAEGLPLSRESAEYWQKRGQAERALTSGRFTQRRVP